MKRKFLYTLILSLFIISACNGAVEAPEPTPIPPTVEPTPVIYSLKAGVDPEEGGLVYPAERQAPADSSIEVEAIPVPGYEFVNWSGADTSTSPNISLKIDGDRQLTAHFVVKLTPTPIPTLTPTPAPCMYPNEITQEDVGKTITVCGKVTNYGFVESDPGTERKQTYSFIKLDKEFIIYSFYWTFDSDWLGACLMVTDTVELYGVNPVFIFDKQDGESGSDCYTEIIGEAQNELYRCPLGDYFQPSFTCEDSHFNLPPIFTHFIRQLNPETK